MLTRTRVRFPAPPSHDGPRRHSRRGPLASRLSTTPDTPRLLLRFHPLRAEISLGGRHTASAGPRAGEAIGFDGADVEREIPTIVTCHAAPVRIGPETEHDFRARIGPCGPALDDEHPR